MRLRRPADSCGGVPSPRCGPAFESGDDDPSILNPVHVGPARCSRGRRRMVSFAKTSTGSICDGQCFHARQGTPGESGEGWKRGQSGPSGGERVRLAQAA
jgi:hypothetical protein